MHWLDSPAVCGGGVAGALVCCFTPLLPALFGLIGLGSLTGTLDYVLIPVLGFFLVALARSLTGARPGIAWGTGGIAVAGFAVLFGRSNPVLALLIVVGAAIALLVTRRH